MTATNKPYNWFAFVVAGAAIAVAVTLGSGGCSSDQDALVVYCAHDQVFSERILRRFEQETGIRVLPRFDTEATKSLGLTNLLISENKHPRCDVFWNNQVLGPALPPAYGFTLSTPT
jgi:iron(III) transport system substrate-binding protein